jgi:hypothetical protein
MQQADLLADPNSADGWGRGGASGSRRTRHVEAVVGFEPNAVEQRRDTADRFGEPFRNIMLIE